MLSISEDAIFGMSGKNIINKHIYHSLMLKHLIVGYLDNKSLLADIPMILSDHLGTQMFDLAIHSELNLFSIKITGTMTADNFWNIVMVIHNYLDVCEISYSYSFDMESHFGETHVTRLVHA